LYLYTIEQLKKGKTMENLKARYKELRKEALTNWYTKDLINEDMLPSEVLSIIPSETLKNERETGIGNKMAELLVDWSMTYKGDGNLANTVKNLNKALS
jgi:hypothetical protein